MNKPAPHIAVNTRLLLASGLEGIGRFSDEILRRMVQAHPEAQFSFFFDRKYDERFIYGPNVTPYVLFPQARHPILFIGFFDWAVPRKLRKLRADVFFSPDGYLSLRTRVPQVPVFHDLAFEHFPQDVKRMEAWHYRRYFPRFAKKASKIITVSEFTRQDIVMQYGIDPGKIEIVYNAVADHFQPIAEAQKQATRAQYSEGKPYFHTVGAIQPRKNLVQLIAAFNKFKSETGSDFKLLIVGRKAWNFEEVIHSYRESSFKGDLVFTGFVTDEELNRIYGASAALCYVPYFEGFGIPLVEAMQCEIPIITGKLSSLPEVAGEAALLVDPHDAADIAAAMSRLSADAVLASQLVDKGRVQKARYSWDRSAERVWNILTNL